MNKPDPARLRIESYPHTVQMQTRFADIDLQMHINSIRMAEIFEEARFRFMSSVGLSVRLDLDRRLVAALNHTYFAEAQYPKDLHVGNAFIKLGRTSWTIGQAAFQSARCVALCDITIVGANAAGPVPISDVARALMRKHELKPG